MSGYPQFLKYFMWSFQVHFKIGCQVKCESLFNHFDRGLTPEAFMIGLRVGQNTDLPQICYEPESMDYFNPYFNEFDGVSRRIHTEDPNRNMMYTGDGVQEEMDFRRLANSKRKAIEEILNKTSEATDKIFFVSSSVRKDNYAVYIILSLDRNVYKSHNHLVKDTFDERFKIYTSVLQTTVQEFLNDCSNNLYFPEPGKNRDSRDYQEILREAARQFMYTISSKGKDFYGLHSLFALCNEISILRYEGEEAFGNLIIARSDHENVNFTLRLSEPFKFSGVRKTRKLLQLSDESVGVICNSHLVLGLGYIKDDYEPENEDIFTIKFKGTHCWEVWHNDRQILIMRYGLPYFANEIIVRKKFFSDCFRIFPNIKEDEIQHLFDLAVAATQQRNGALLVITDDAESEANRLKMQSIAIQPTKVDIHTLLNLTSIDGGVLIDRHGVAYSQGVILDGIVGKNGDSSRGSRYNSAITYYHFKGIVNPMLIVVVSEDGMVDIIPNLRIQIKKSEITNLISALESLRSDFDRGAFNEIIFSLKSREFYLSDEECQKINILKNELDVLEGTSIRIVHSDFTANPDMNESYFISE